MKRRLFFADADGSLVNDLWGAQMPTIRIQPIYLGAMMEE